jgi:hypothetical protein
MTEICTFFAFTHVGQISSLMTFCAFLKTLVTETKSKNRCTLLPSRMNISRCFWELYKYSMHLEPCAFSLRNVLTVETDFLFQGSFYVKYIKVSMIHSVPLAFLFCFLKGQCHMIAILKSNI